jgi:hypothetical protein
MRYLIVRTEVRAVGPDEVVAAWADGARIRDERTDPEPRRQIVLAEDREAAFKLARALAAVGAVRAGRQRIKVVRVAEPSI